MAFVKVLALAVCLSAANAAPQLLRTFHGVPATRTVHALPQTVVRTAPAATVSSHSSHVTHEVPSVVRSAVVAQPAFTRVASPVVHSVAQPAFTRAVSPVVHSVAHPVEHAVVRTAPTFVDAIEPSDATYSYGYSVNDALTGDSKTREETADHGVVTGSYSVAQPDGRVRTVTYHADAINGFEADVTYDGEYNAPPAIPIDAPAVVAPVAPASTVIAARGSAIHHAVPAAQTIVRTAPAVHHAIPAAQTVVRTAPAVHAIPAAQTVVRTAAPAFHALPAAQTVVRTAPAVHALPATTVVRAHQPAFVSAAQPAFVRSAPFGTTQFIHA